MASKIHWTENSWNPLVGCSRISAGCKNCYAESAAKSARLQQFPQYQSVKEWDGTIEFVENQLLKPLSWKSPKKIFVCSMSDIFHANVEDEWLNKIFAVMAIASQHTFQVLTKRPERMQEYFALHKGKPECYASRSEMVFDAVKEIKPQAEWDKFIWPLPNVWLGTSIENQKAADDRIALLLQTPATVRFLSCEPLLELVDLRQYLGVCVGCQTCDFQGGHPIAESKINWVIVGGESGTGARPCEIDWLRSIISQCKSAKVAVFVKQLGSMPMADAPIDYEHDLMRVKLKDRKGGDIDEFYEDLKVRQLPQ